MNQLIRRLIDVYLVQPLATAVTQHLEGGQQKVMDALDKIKQQLDGVNAALTEAKIRAAKLVSRFDDLQKQIAGHPSIEDDPRLAAILAEATDMSAAAAAIVPDTPPAEPAPATAAAVTDAPPPDPNSDEFKAGKDT